MRYHTLLIGSQVVNVNIWCQYEHLVCEICLCLQVFIIITGQSWFCFCNTCVKIMFQRHRNTQRPQSPREVLKLTWYNYAESASIHGLNYASNMSLVRLRRVSWALVFGVCTSFAIFLVVRAYKNWQDNPVITTIQSTGIINIRAGEIPKKFITPSQNEVYI